MTWMFRFVICFTVSLVSLAPTMAAEDGMAFTVEKDDFGPVYRIDMQKVKSAADLAAVPGVKIAWDLSHSGGGRWLANVRDIEGDGTIDLLTAGEVDGKHCIFRYSQDGRLLWTSEPVGDSMGHESGLAIEDLDGDGSFEAVFNVLGSVVCLDARTGKTKWKVELPKGRDNHQAGVVGHFLDRKRFSVVCRVYHDVFCYDENGKMAWKYRIDNPSAYGHDMAHYDADGDGLDEIYMSLDGKFLVVDGNGKTRWADTECRNHSDFILCGDVDGDGKNEMVYDRCGCAHRRGPIVSVDGATGKLERQWDYARPGKDHLQKAVLGDFDPARPGLELAAVGKSAGKGGLILWNKAGKPYLQKDIAAGWAGWGNWTGEKNPQIFVSVNDGWEVWTGGGQRLYAIRGVGSMPLGVESAGPRRRDNDGNGRAETLLSPRDGYIVLMEKP